MKRIGNVRTGPSWAVLYNATSPALLLNADMSGGGDETQADHSTESVDGWLAADAVWSVRLLQLGIVSANA